MGNNLSSIAPLQILPHEFYIAELSVKWPRLTYKKSLNAARFLKSALCQIGARDCVVKLFVLSEQLQDLKPFRDEIELIAQRLESASNCIPYFALESTERAVYLVRQYEKTNLYDRMSMRPFLSIIEKKWIAFQILTALKQCHEQDTCHGDIKMENLLVTPWLWIYLTDFASYKPVRLPEDDPADYSYFFDPSWRRLGYVAPERFFNSVCTTGADKCMDGAVLTPAMDMFSAGCVLAELFADTPLFDLPSLFRYMADEYYPKEILNQIEDDGIKMMVTNMISKDPSDRKSATHFLEDGKGQIFPNNFYNFLWPLMAQNRENEIGVATLLPGMMEFINHMETVNSGKPQEDDEISTIFATIIASNLDDIKDGEGRMTAIQILGSLAGLVPEYILNDTILPAVVYLIKHVEESSTALSLYTLRKCISKYNSVPRTCTNLFRDCIYPCIGEAVRDEKFFVRRGVAENIGFFAQTSHRFLIFSMMKKYVIDYAQGKKTLEDSVNKIVASVFCDSVPSVRKAIANHSIERLCSFFGEHKASDALMSHLITYLNEKKDYLLRMSFYPSIVTVARNVGYRPAELIKPLLLQGISDVEESIAAVSLQAMERLVKMKEFHRRHLCSILEQVAVLLVHPNIWIRASVVRLLSVICQNQPVIAVLSIFKPKILPFLSNDITQLGDEAVLWGSLRPKISINIFEEFLKSSNVSLLLTALRNALDKNPGKVARKAYSDEEPKDNDQKNAVRRLLAYGVTADMLNILGHMKDHFKKVNTNQESVDASLNIVGKQAASKAEIPSTSISLSIDFLQSMYLNVPNMEDSEQKSTDWEVMYGSSPSKAKSPYSSVDRSRNPLNTNLMTSENDKSTDGYSDNLVFSSASHKQLDAYINSKVSKFPFEHHSYKPRKSPSMKNRVDADWRPEGKIIAHLHEHRQGITRLAQIPGRTYYVSASIDGTSKIWDSAKTERKYPVNKSKGTYKAEGGGSLISLACCSSGDSVAVGDDKGSIEIFKLDRLDQIAGNQLKETDFMATDMHFMDLGSNNVLTYGTPYSNICGWDLRSKDVSFRLENDNKIGPITSYVISPCQTYLVHGTSFGFIVCWDLRYRMPVSQIKHPEGWDIRRVKLHPTNSAMVVAAMSQNNEIDFYGLEFKTKSKVLWASPASPVKGNTTAKYTIAEEDQIKNNVYGLHVDKTKSGDIFVLSGGEDCKLRYWNINQPEESKYICNSYTGGRLMYNIPFSSKEINGTEYIIESFSHKKPLMSSEQINNVPIQPYPGHKDTITDILMVYEPKMMIISSSMDGVIKMWK